MVVILLYAAESDLKSLPLGEDIMVDTIVVVDVMTTLLKTDLIPEMYMGRHIR
jgi:hypothetical protein